MSEERTKEKKDMNPTIKKETVTKRVRVLKSGPVFIVLFFLYCELLFHFVRFGTVSSDLSYKILFSMMGGVVVSFLIGWFKNRIAKVITALVMMVVTLYYVAQIIYSGVFSTYLSLWGTKDVAGQALDFTNVIMGEGKREWFVLVLFFLPVLYYLFDGRKRICFNGQTKKSLLLQGGIFLGLSLGTCFWMQKDAKEVYSAYDLYTNYSSVDLTITRLGVLEGFVLDTKAGVMDWFGVSFGATEFVMEEETKEVAQPDNTEKAKEEVAVKQEEKVDDSPNVLPLDLKQMAAMEENEEIAAIHEYISGLEPTNKNEYTGMFEGYNVVFVVAEGFSGYCIDKERTPTLYKLVHEGFCFENYYTPLWYGSTLGGEFADLTGLMPKNGGYLSMQKVGDNENNMMFTLGKQLSQKDYKVTAYHANSHTYYEREKSRPVLGYDWIAVGSGYEPELGKSGKALWPQSDLRLVETTFEDYAKEEPFYTYYLTVSGHVEYSFSGNAMAKRHQDLVKDLDYSETAKAYIACQNELELAMEELICRLEEKGLLERTLIVLTADHVPYDNKEVVDELAGETLDETFDWYKNALVIWSGSMEEPVVVDKYCSSVDVLPTVSNLLGLEYDSRMLVGRDILSDSEGIVMFNDRSFITDICRYNAKTGKVTETTQEAVSEEYINQRIAYVKNKFSLAENIVQYDYYRYIEEELK